MASTLQPANATKDKPEAGMPAPKRAASKRATAKRPGNRAKTVASEESVLVRGKKVLGDAYSRASEAGNGLHHSLANLSVPSPRSLQTFAEEKPLVVGAVGIGVGMILGAVLPSIGRMASRAAPQKTSIPPRRRKRG